MSAIYNSETRKHSWWEPMPSDFWAKVNGQVWKREYAYHISDSSSYEVDLYWGDDDVHARAKINLSSKTKVCLFVGIMREDAHGLRKGDFVIATGRPSDCDDASNLTLLWRPAPDWMASINGDKKLSEFNIPGTHDTCSLHGGPQTETQSMRLGPQLYAGIRFIDIRCRHLKDTFLIYHGDVSQKLDFGRGVRKVCIDYLKQHPNETIVMLVKETSSASGNKRSFEDTMKAYIKDDPDYWFTEDYIPKLDEARGKIVLVRSFSGDIGIPAYDGWAKDNCTFTLNDEEWSDLSKNKLRIQDCYSMSDTVKSFDDKWAKIRSLFSQATDGNRNVWYWNYISGSSSGFPILCFPSHVAKKGLFGQKGMNKRLEEYLDSAKSDRYGTIIMDFPEWENNKLIPLILDKN